MIWVFFFGVIIGCNIGLIFLVVMARNHKQDLRRILDEMNATLGRAVEAKEEFNKKHPDRGTDHAAQKTSSSERVQGFSSGTE